MGDSWADTWQRLTKLGWGHERPHTPGRHGASTDRYYFPGYVIQTGGAIHKHPAFATQRSYKTRVLTVCVFVLS